MPESQHPLEKQAAQAAAEIVQGLQEAQGRGWIAMIQEIYVRQIILKHLPAIPPDESRQGLVDLRALETLLNELDRFSDQARAQIGAVRASNQRVTP